ncbi:MAG: DUF4124 domain-containing protein [Proteobacteria bacterium]|nr:DUF4124 domain-containing protein [Pseudomonadota bacterium]
MKRLPMALCLALSLTLGLALPASAQMYKWVDSNGKVQYSDKPPPSNVKTEKLRESAPAPAPAPSAPAAGDGKGGAKQDAAKSGPKTVAEQEQAFRKRQLDSAKAREEAGQKQAESRDRTENCTRAKAAVASLQMGGRQVRIDEKGERVFLDDQQIAQELARAKQDAASACN